MGWTIALGILFVITGIIALAVPVTTSVALGALLGVLFLVNGVAQLVHAIRFTGQGGDLFRYLSSLLFVAAGVLALRNPVAGAAGITLILAFFLFASSFARWMLASDIRPEKGWVMLFASALVSFALGVFLVASLPAASLTVPGILFGIDMVIFGGTLIGAAMQARKVGKALEFPERGRPAA